jgi:hypothetical protein
MRVSRDMQKMPSKWVSLSIRAPLWNLEGVRMWVLFERKEQYIWVRFLDPEGIKILSLGII